MAKHGLNPAFAAENLHALEYVWLVCENLGQHEFAFAGE